MKIRTESPRKILADQIAMIEGAIEYTRSLGETPSPRQFEVLARYRAELAAMPIGFETGHAVGAVENPVPLHLRPAAGSAASNQFGTFEVKYATDKQVRYIAFLLESRNLASLANSMVFDLARLREAVLAGKVNKRTASDAITRLLGCPEAVPALEADEKPAVSRPASEKQVGLIRKLAAERTWQPAGEVDPSSHAGTVADVLAGTAVESRDASAAIDFLFGCAKVTQAATPAEALTLGMYRTPAGSIFRVYPAKADPTRLLAKELLGMDDDFHFEYAGLASRFVTAADKMSLEEAKAYGHQFGVCCVCAAHLTDPISVAAGIGPVCAGRV